MLITPHFHTERGVWNARCLVIANHFTTKVGKVTQNCHSEMQQFVNFMNGSLSEIVPFLILENHNPPRNLWIGLN